MGVKKTAKLVAGGAVGAAVVVGSVILLHKSGAVTHVGTLVDTGKGFVVEKAKVVGESAGAARKKVSAAMKRRMKGGQNYTPYEEGDLEDVVYDEEDIARASGKRR